MKELNGYVETISKLMQVMKHTLTVQMHVSLLRLIAIGH